MSDRKPTLEYAAPEARKRPRFLEKLNPKATWRSVVRKAILSSGVAAGLWWLFRLNSQWHPTWWMFVCWEVIAAGVGAVTEWQPVDGDALLSPDTQRLVEERLKRGQYRSVDELVRAALNALNELDSTDLDSATLDAIDRAEDQIEHGEVCDWKDAREKVREQFVRK